MDKQRASAEIAALLELANDALNKAVAISEKSGVEFTTPWGGEGCNTRGMGATYYPEGHPDIDESCDYYSDYARAGWNSSAGTC